MADVKAMLQAKIAQKKVVLFGISHCTYCKNSRRAFLKYIDKELPEDEYESCNIEDEDCCDDIKATLTEMTGATNMPWVFIGGKYIGGCAQTAELDRNGDLIRLLTN